MGPVSSLVEVVADVLGVRRETVSAYARALIDDGLLPKASGRRVPDVEAIHVARLLIGVALEPKIKSVAEYVRLYGELRSEAFPDKLKNAEEFIACLVEECANPAKSGDEKIDDMRIEVVESWPEIVVYDKDDGSIVRYCQPGQGKFWRADLRRAAKFGTHAILKICVRMQHLREGEA